MGTTCVSRPPPRGPPDEEWQGPDPLEGHQLRSMAEDDEAEAEAEGGVGGEGGMEGGVAGVAADGTAARTTGHTTARTAARSTARIAPSDATLAGRAARASRSATAPLGARAAEDTPDEVEVAGVGGDVEGEEGETVRALTRAAKKMLLGAEPAESLA